MNTKPIAYTNHLLARVRRALSDADERYTKWYLGGAFNGANLVGPTGTFDILFYASAPTSGDWHTVLTIGDVFVSLCPPQTVDVLGIIRGALEEAHRDFDMNAAHGLVQRVQISAIFRPDLVDPDAVARGAVAHLEAALGARCCQLLHSPSLFEDGTHELEAAANIVAVDVETLRGRLREVSSAFDGHELLGWGVLIINHDGDAFPDPAMLWAHLTFRHA